MAETYGGSMTRVMARGKKSKLQLRFSDHWLQAFVFHFSKAISESIEVIVSTATVEFIMCISNVATTPG